MTRAAVLLAVLGACAASHGRAEDNVVRTRADAAVSGPAGKPVAADDVPSDRRRVVSKIDLHERPTGTFQDRTVEEIQRVVATRAGVLRACYQLELTRTPGLAGKVVLTFSIQPDGAVSNVLFDDSATTLRSDAVVECLQAQVARLKFPPRDKPSEVTYPIGLSTGP